MMTKDCSKVLVMCLILALVSGLEESSSALDWEGTLGMDLCPECRDIPAQAPTVLGSGSNGKQSLLEFNEKSEVVLTTEYGSGSDQVPEALVRRWDAPQSPLELDDALGVDMCPECGSLPATGVWVDFNSHEIGRKGKELDDGLGIGMCPECRSQQAMGGMDYNSLEIGIKGKELDDQFGMDMCPECRSLPAMGGMDYNSLEIGIKGKELDDQFGMDMCPECRSLPAVGEVDYNSYEIGMKGKELGLDTCSGCMSQQAEVLSQERNLREVGEEEKDLGVVDMYPDISHIPSTNCKADENREGKGKPLSVAANCSVCCSEETSDSLVKELQHLVTLQQLQIDKLAELLQQLVKTRANVDQEDRHSLKQPAFDSQGSNVRVAVGLKNGMEPAVVDTNDNENPRSFVTFRHDMRETMADGESASVEGVEVEAGRRDGDTGIGGRTVARYRPAWSQHFSFLSAVKVEGEVSCLHMLPQEGDDGISRYVVVGDMTGRIYIFIWLGDLLFDYLTISTSPITAMLSYVLQKNETILVTGHQDGAVLVHQLWETVEQGSFLRDGGPIISSIRALHPLNPPPSSTLRGSDSSGNDLVQEEGVFAQESVNMEAGGEENMSPIVGTKAIGNLELFRVGKMKYTLVGDASGKIQLFRENGSLYGVAQSPQRPLAFMRTPNTQRLVFLTEVGVGSVELRSMVVNSNPCEGLNGSRVMAYAFDVTGRSKAHGVTRDGVMVSIVLSGDALHYECHVKKKRKVDFTGPFSLQALRGYLLAASPNYILGFNTSLQSGLSYANFWVAGPRPIFSVTSNEIAVPFMKTPIPLSRWPLVATNRDKMVIVGFGTGYVGVFRSNLPTSKPADFSTKFWNSSALISVLVVLVLWQLFTRRRDSGSGGNQDYPSSTRLGFGDTGKVGRRRFKSPTRGYVSGNPAPFRSGTSNFRSSSVDSGSYGSMREPLFASTQPVEDVLDDNQYL